MVPDSEEENVKEGVVSVVAEETAVTTARVGAVLSLGL